jgi:hypothetical protein
VRSIPQDRKHQEKALDSSSDDLLFVLAETTNRHESQSMLFRINLVDIEHVSLARTHTSTPRIMLGYRGYSFQVVRKNRIGFKQSDNNRVGGQASGLVGGTGRPGCGTVNNERSCNCANQCT